MEDEYPLLTSIYEVSAMGLAGEIERPLRLSVKDPASTVLSRVNGYETKVVENVQVNGLVSAKSVRSNVGSSFDDKQGLHTAFACAVVEDLNICEVVTADRVVARLSASRSLDGQESSFFLTGTVFENLKIAGKHVAPRLATDVFGKNSTFSDVKNRYEKRELDKHLHGKELPDDRAALPYISLQAVQKLRHRYQQPKSKGIPTWFTLANHLEVAAGPGELQTFGSIILVPDFGVLHLAELFVTERQRRLSMLRLELGSPTKAELEFATCSVSDTTDSTGPR